MSDNVPIASSTKKVPPGFDPQADTAYKDFRKLFDVWAAFTDLANADKGPALTLRLRGRAQQVALSMPVSELSLEDGIVRLLALLDEKFGEEEQDTVKKHLKKFFTLRRKSGQGMQDFMAEFWKAYENARLSGLTIALVGLSFLIMWFAEITEDEASRVLTTVQGDYTKKDEIEKALKRLVPKGDRNVPNAVLFGQ